MRAKGPVLELGSGTGRISLPLIRAGVSLVGVDRSQLMLRRAARRSRALRSRGRGRMALVRGDIRALPFAPGRFEMVIAPYGVLQSMLSERDLSAALGSVSRVLTAGGIFGVDLVPDVPNWKEYRNQVQLRVRPAEAPSHARRISAPRSATASDDLRAEVHRTTRKQENPAPIRAHISNAAGACHGPSP